MKRVRYEEMLPREVVEARSRCPVAYLPLGTLEWHGEHNCLGLDGVKVQALAERLAERGGGLVLPSLFWGENRESIVEFNEVSRKVDPQGRIYARMGLSGGNFAPGYMKKSGSDQDQFYVELLVHVMREVESLGFKAIVILAGHYPLLSRARQAIDIYSRDGKVRAWACSGYELVRDQIPDAGDHAAGWETSLMLALRPDCVDMSRLPSEPAEAIGTFGARPPQQASKEYGERGVELVMERILFKVAEMLVD